MTLGKSDPQSRKQISDSTQSLGELREYSFDKLPTEKIVRAYGVEYAHISPPNGGDLYITRSGWSYADQLLPSNWYADKWYVEKGERLTGSTGNVYHVHSKPVNGKQADLVVKFSRVAQEISVVVETTFPDDIPPETIAMARFNSPMEEFGLVMELRRGVFGPEDIKILTHRPFAIYVPPEQLMLWQLGRQTYRFNTHSRLLAEDQEKEVKAIELDIKRIYVLLYEWVKGKDAEQFYNDGFITEEEFYQLTPRVVNELRKKGFRVLDCKPNHFILRKRKKDNKIMRRDKKHLTYSLVDFELLQRTPENQQQFKNNQWKRYHKLQAKSGRIKSNAPSSHLKNMTIFNMDFIFGKLQDGGRLFILGQDPDLFDYFVPDRWRRTPRIKLSPHNEVYRTRTRDNVDLVYRRSLVGSRPRVDPLKENGKQIRQHGYNSPFEEIAIAELLRKLGIRTILPRAVYRTAHQSTKAAYLCDMQRFKNHEHIQIPSEKQESILIPDYDYYTIWDHFLGFCPDPRCSEENAIGLNQAKNNGLVEADDYEKVVSQFKNTLLKCGLVEEQANEYELTLYLDEQGKVFRDEKGKIKANLGIDALISYELGLISEEMYRNIIQRLNTRLHAVDCEKLDLRGSHLLLSMDPGGNFQIDRDGEMQVTLCNFEFIRGIYRPFR